VTAVVDLWWSRGSEIAAPNDAPIHCRASDYQAGLPVSWRSGERARFLTAALKHYESEQNARVTPSAGWRLNGANGGHHLSLSDSGAHLACGVGLGVPVGIDLERARPVDDPLTTLRGLGLHELADRLSALAPAARNRAFLSLWTAFEAFLKLERLQWEVGAEHFAALAAQWTVSAAGAARFSQSGRSGLFFVHVEPEPAIIVAIATPAPCECRIRRIALAKSSRKVPRL
jgi:hypothetical protein